MRKEAIKVGTPVKLIARTAFEGCVLNYGSFEDVFIVKEIEETTNMNFYAIIDQKTLKKRKDTEVFEIIAFLAEQLNDYYGRIFLTREKALIWYIQASLDDIKDKRKDLYENNEKQGIHSTDQFN